MVALATPRAERAAGLALTRVTGVLVADAQVRLAQGASQIVVSVRLTQGAGADWIAEQARPNTPAHWIAAKHLAACLRRDTVATVHARAARPATRSGQRVQQLVDVTMIEVLDVVRRGGQA